MATPVRPRAQKFQLGACAVGRPVSAAHGRRTIEDLAFVLAQANEYVADAHLRYSTASTPLTVPVLYARSPGAQCIEVGCELMEADSGGRGTVTVTNNGAALTWVNHNLLDGSGSLACPATNTARQPVYWGTVDVTGLPTDGTVQTLQFGYVNTATAAGLRRVFVREAPQGSVDPVNDTDEPSANDAWPYPRRNARDGLVDGDTNLSLGFKRLHDQLEQARTKVRVHRQWCTYEDDTMAAQTASTSFAALNWRSDSWAPGDDPILVVRGRRYYGNTALTAQPEQTRAYIRYKCGGTGGTVRFIINGTNVDKAVAAAGSWTTLSLADVSLPTDQSGNRVTVKLNGKVATTGSLRIAAWLLLTNE